MSAKMNSLNAHNLPIFQTILITFVSKFMVHRALSDKTYLSLGLLSPLRIFGHRYMYAKELFSCIKLGLKPNSGDQVDFVAVASMTRIYYSNNELFGME